MDILDGLYKGNMDALNSSSLIKADLASFDDYKFDFHTIISMSQWFSNDHITYKNDIWHLKK